MIFPSVPHLVIQAAETKATKTGNIMKSVTSVLFIHNAKKRGGGAQKIRMMLQICTMSQEADGAHTNGKICLGNGDGGHKSLDLHCKHSLPFFIPHSIIRPLSLSSIY